MKKIALVTFLLYSTLLANPIAPIPLDVKVDTQKAKLGKALFFDPILSLDGTISCATCHDIENGGDDGLRVSFGIKGREGNINSPTVLNARFNFVQFWDGRAKDLKKQALGPIQNHVEMNNNFKNLIKTLNNSHYKEKFEKIYKNGITKENIVDAIAEYEMTLITPNSRFDKFLRGDKEALSELEKKGYEIFKQKGCIACHNGINIGGNMFAKFGFFKGVVSGNLGRYNVTKDEDDKYIFKVPTLRNIALTSPYMHDGRFDSLEDAVEFMMSFQLGEGASEEEVRLIVEFLKSLNGEVYDFETN